METHTDEKEAKQMTGFRRAIAWVIISVVILSLVVTMVVGRKRVSRPHLRKDS